MPPMNMDDLPPFRAIGALPSGLLPIPIADQDLRVEIDWWDGIHEHGTLQLLWKGRLYGAEQVVTEEQADDPSSVFTFVIAQAELVAEGDSTLAYRFLTFPGSNELFSAVQTIRVDRTPPGGNALPRLIFDDAVIERGVTRASLDDQGRLHATLQAYEQKRVNDIVQPLILAERQGLPVEVPDAPIRVTSNDQNAPVAVFFNLSALLQAGDGPARFTYTLTDRAGNTSVQAPDQALHILLQDVPDRLEPARVPLYEEKGLIDEAAARQPVQMHVPHYTHAAVDDEVRVSWGGVPVGPFFISDPGQDPLLRLDIPYRLVQRAGNGVLEVTYEVLRNGGSLGTAPATGIEVDISLPGGPDPDPENPTHGNLEPASALGRSGVPNIISAEDREHPAEVIIQWNGFDQQEVFIEGDQVSATWASENLAHRVSAEEAAAKQPLVLTISSEQIKRAGTGTLALAYSVTRDLAGHPGHSNTAYAAPQQVEVADPAELPGGGDELPKGDFPEKNLYNTINNIAAEDGTPYVVQLNYKNAAVGDVIAFMFRGHQGVGDDPSLDPDRPIAGSKTESRHVVTQEDLDHGSYAFTVDRTFLNRQPRIWSANGYHWISNRAGTAPGNAYYHVLIDVFLPTPTPAQVPAKKRFSVAATLAALWSWLRCR